MKKIRIIYDYQALGFQKYGGISRYFYELYVFFRETNKRYTSAKLPIVFSCNFYFDSYVKARKTYIGKYGLLANQIKTIINIYGSFLRGKPYDIIHPTYYYPEYMKFIPQFIRKKSKLVITVHDLICEMFYPQNEDLEKRKNIIREADAIVTVSEKTKEDLLRIYPFVDEKRVKVIYHGNSMMKPTEKPVVKLPDEYILMVGNRSEYKNGVTLFRALMKIREKNENIHLVCIGGGTFSNEEMQEIKALGINHFVIQKSLSDQELYYAYKYAKCFVFPSLYEGFGIPILEAFFCGCPVILSNASCFPEIGQDAALYFEPDNVEDLSEKICFVLDNPEMAIQLSHKGKERLKNFSWEKTQKETFEFYKMILNNL